MKFGQVWENFNLKRNWATIWAGIGQRGEEEGEKVGGLHCENWNCLRMQCALSSSPALLLLLLPLSVLPLYRIYTYLANAFEVLTSTHNKSIIITKRTKGAHKAVQWGKRVIRPPLSTVCGLSDNSIKGRCCVSLCMCVCETHDIVIEHKGGSNFTGNPQLTT